MGVWTAEARAKRGAAYGESAGLLFVGTVGGTWGLVAAVRT